MKTFILLCLLSLIGCSGCVHTGGLKLNIQCEGLRVLQMDVAEASKDVSVPLSELDGDTLDCHVEIYGAK